MIYFAKHALTCVAKPRSLFWYSAKVAKHLPSASNSYAKLYEMLIKPILVYKYRSDAWGYNKKGLAQIYNKGERSYAALLSRYQYDNNGI